jgi:hypothetical protein
MNSELSYAAKPTSEDAAAPRNFFSRLIGVYFSPGETFVEMSKAPRALAPIIALTLFFLFSSAFLASRGVTWEKLAVEQTQKALAAGRVSDEQAGQQVDGIRKMAPVMNVGLPIISAIWAVVMVFALAGLAKLWSMMLGIENRYMPLVSVMTYASLAAYIVSTAILVILVFIKPVDEFDWTNPIGSNLATLFTALGVEGLPSFVKGLLSYVDVIFIWKVALIAIGCAAVSHKLKTSSAMVHAGIVACVIALIMSVLGMLGGA